MPSPYSPAGGGSYSGDDLLGPPPDDFADLFAADGGASPVVPALRAAPARVSRAIPPAPPRAGSVPPGVVGDVRARAGAEGAGEGGLDESRGTGISFSDAPAIRAAVYARTLARFKEVAPVANKRFELSLADVHYADSGEFSEADRKRAILEGGTLSRKLRGTWVLKDVATGSEVGRRKSTLARVPYYTRDGTFVLGGSDWTLATQQRLLPGVYNRVRGNGELESHVNVPPGKGLSHRVQLDPETGVFTIRAGGSTVPLLPVLKALGVGPDAIREAWGDLASVNGAVPEGHAVKKFHDKVVRQVDPDDQRTPAGRLRDALAAMPLDPDVTRSTLGEAFDRVTPAVYLAATKRLIGINRGDQDPDDRDHLAYMRVLGPEDLIAERAVKDSGPIRKALWRATMKNGDLSGVPAGVYTDAILAAIQRSGLGQPSECFAGDGEVATRRGFVPWPEVTRDDEFACLIDGAVAWRRPFRLIRNAHAGRMYGRRCATADYLVTPEHRIYAADGRGGAFGFETAEAAHGKRRVFSISPVPEGCGTDPDAAPPEGTDEYWETAWTGTVYCATVPGGLLYVRRAGVAHWSGNSVNPGMWLEQMSRVSRMGVGGISDSDAIPDESKATQPSHFGYVDPVATPENARAGVDVRFARTVLRDPSGRIRAKFRNMRKGGALESISPDALVDAVVAFPDATREPGARVVEAMHRGRMGLYPVEEVDYELPRMEEAFSPLSNLVPMKAGVKGQRAAMGQRMSVVASTRIFVVRVSGSVYRGPIGEYGWRPGDRACSIDETTCKVVWKPVLAKIVHANDKRIFRVELEGGRHVDATEDHAFVTLGDDGSLVEIATRDVGRGTPIPCMDVVPEAGAERPALATLGFVSGRARGLAVAAEGTHVPEWAFAAPRAYREGVVAGYLAGAARVLDRGGVATVRTWPATARLCADVCDLLATIGVATYRGRARGSDGADRWRIGVRVDHVAKLPSTGDPVKDAALAAHSWDGRRGTDWLPSYAGLRAAVSEATAPGADERRLGREGRLTKAAVAALPIPEGDRARLWAESDVAWELPRRVYELPAGAHPIVYDLDLGGATFACGGGVFVHNSSQALPLVGAEAPLVRNSSADDDGSYERKFGHEVMGAVRADGPAWVRDVRPDGIVLRKEDGTERTIELARDVPTNRKTGFTQTAAVRPGQFVGPGDLLARSNFTDADGVTALGRNVRVAMVPGFGEHSNYEDAWVISRGAAEKFKSEHYYQHAVDAEDGGSIDRKTFLAAFPAKYPKNVIDRFDDDGVIKPGTEVAKGDPLVLAVRRRVDDGTRIHAGRKPSMLDASETWDHDSQGVVTDVARTKSGVNVVVRTEAPATVGDKLCLTPDHDVLTLARGWVPIADVTLDDEVACLVDGAAAYRNPYEVHVADNLGEPLYSLEAAEVSLLATAGHRLYGRLPGRGERTTLAAREAFGTGLAPATSGPFGRGRQRDVDVSDAVEGWVAGYVGKVYCLTVPGGLFYVRRNGKAVWTGNSNRFGSKGVIGSIVPDEDMPRDEDGNIIDLLFNPAGVVTRTNPAVSAEFGLGKAAAKTGRTYDVPAFDEIADVNAYAREEMRRAGVSDEGFLTDPRTGRRIDGVTTGVGFFMKLHHMVADKNQGRGIGGYTLDGRPAKAGENAAKRLPLMSLNALLSSGATEVAKDALHVRGQANADYWARFMAGHNPPSTEVPFVHREYVQKLKAGGVNVTREGTRFKIHALRGKDVDELTGGRLLRNAETVDHVTMKPVPGGLFDEALTGGPGSEPRWAAIGLAEPIVSPVFEDPARRLLGLTGNEYRDVIAGRRELNGATGPTALADALKGLDVPREMARARAEIASGRKTARDAAVKRLKYLKAADKDGIHPGDWVWDKVPVLPPVFRGVSRSKATGRLDVADANVLYGELFEADEVLRAMRGKVDDVGEERLAVYDAAKAVVGLGDPVHPDTAKAGVRGILKEVMGSSPKHGHVQRKLLSSTVDLVGRSVITPSPDLDMDSIGIPESKAWEIYSPFVVRRLTRRGAKLSDALRLVKDRDPRAREGLVAEMDARPVLADRAPVWHRFGVMAFRPKLVQGDAIRMNPLVTTGFGADFDGDQMNYQVVAGERAVEEAYAKLLPSKNLFAPVNFKVHQVPLREFAAGLWLATRARPGADRPRVFATKADALAAYRRGEIAADQPVAIAGD